MDSRIELIEDKVLQNKTLLQRISNILLMNGHFLTDVGLYSGLTGLSLFFFHYARYSKKVIYSGYGFELIEKMQKLIHKKTPVGYMYGLTGIGSTIEYFAQNDYIECDTDDILEDFDQLIFSENIQTRFTVKELIDTGYYALWRMSGTSAKKNWIQKDVLPQIRNMVEDKGGKTAIPVWLHSDCRDCMGMPSGFKIRTSDRLLKRVSQKDCYFKEDFRQGIENGLAGLGLALLSEMDSDETWTALFPYR